jgi:hypothetical protein
MHTVVPNLRKLGLLTDRTESEWRRLGMLTDRRHLEALLKPLEA